MRTLLFILLSLSCLAQKGGLPTYPLTRYDSTFIPVDNTDSLVKYAGIPGSKIYITKSFELKKRVTVAANVRIESDLKTITSKLFFSTFRVFESFTIEGKNVTFRGLNLVGDDPDIRTLDTLLYQCGIRCHADSFTMLNCRMSKWGWACVYLHYMGGARIEQCFFADTKNYGYGYSLWCEGKGNQTAIIKDNLFENCREGIDAGGVPNSIIITGNVAESGFCTHKNGVGWSALNTTITGNYMINSSLYYFPPSDSGKLTITGNYLTDTSAIFTNGTNPKSTIIIEDNKPLIQTPFLVNIDSIVGNRVYFRFNDTYPLYEVFYGDGTDRKFTVAKKLNKSYPFGSFTIKARGIDKNGIPSAWGTKRFNIKSKAITAFIKSGSRFNKAGEYSLQFLRNDTVIYSIDATKVWKWTRVYLPCEKGKMAFRVVCNKQTNASLICFVDDFEYNGSLLNSDFETKGVWVQKLVGSIGSGQDERERTSGKSSYRFEFRSTPNVNGYGEISQTIK